MSNVFRVDGMTCGGCARAIENALSPLFPGAAIEVNLEAGLVSIDAEADEATVKTAVEDAGFTFLGRA